MRIPLILALGAALLPGRSLASPSRTFLFYVSSDDAQLYGDSQFVEHLKRSFREEGAEGSQALVLFDSMDPDRAAEMFSIRDRQDQAVTSLIEFSTEARQRCVPDPSGYTEKGGLPSVDMGCVHTFEGFLRVARTLPPTDETYLFLVGHGSGWMGFGADSNADRDQPAHFLSLGDLTGAMAEFVRDRGKLTGVVFNACLMGTWEVALEFAPLSRWFSAPSQSVVLAGSDLVDDIANARAAGRSSAWIHEQIRRPYDFLAFHFKVRPAAFRDLDARLLLLSVQDSRTVVERGGSGGVPKRFGALDSPQARDLAKGDWKVSSMNNLLVDLERLGSLEVAFVEEVIPRLIGAFQSDPRDLTSLARIETPTFLSILEGDPSFLASLGDLLAFASIEKELKARIDAPFEATYKASIRPFSVFLPSTEFSLSGSLSEITEGSKFHRTVWETFDRTRFATKFRWKHVVSAYLGAFASRLRTSNDSVSELDFGRSFVE